MKINFVKAANHSFLIGVTVTLSSLLLMLGLVMYDYFFIFFSVTPQNVTEYMAEVLPTSRARLFSMGFSIALLGLSIALLGFILQCARRLFAQTNNYNAK